MTDNDYKNPAIRFNLLNSILYHLLPNDLISKEEKREQYYKHMAVYFDAERINVSEMEAKIEHNLVVKVEAEFVHAMMRDELSEERIGEIKREQAERYSQVKKLLDESKIDFPEPDLSFIHELKKFPDMEDK